MGIERGSFLSRLRGKTTPSEATVPRELTIEERRDQVVEKFLKGGKGSFVLPIEQIHPYDSNPAKSAPDNDPTSRTGDQT